MGGEWAVAVRQEGLLWKTVTGGVRAKMLTVGSKLSDAAPPGKCSGNILVKLVILCFR